MAMMEATRINMERCRTVTESLCDVIFVMRRRKTRSPPTQMPTNTACVVFVRMVERAIQLITTRERATKAQLAVSGSVWRLDHTQRNHTMICRTTQTVRQILKTTESIMVWVMVWGGNAERP